MTDDPILCHAQTFAGRMYNDPEPASYCENEVENLGDLCSEHDEDDRADELYEQYLESKYDDEQDNPWGNDEDEERT